MLQGRWRCSASLEVYDEISVMERAAFAASITFGADENGSGAFGDGKE
jgi:hypothetical protein